MMTVNIADFTDFKNEIVRNILDYLPEEYSDSSVEIKEVLKNNDQKLSGLNIKRQDVNMVPTIYMDEFYRDFENGKDIEVILKEIADMRVKFDVTEDYDISYISNYHVCKDIVVPRLVNASMNKELLAERPHRDIEDLAVIYAVELNEEMSIPVNNKMVELWDVTEEELFRQALKNMPSKAPSKLASMREVLIGMMAKDMGDDIAEQMAEDMYPAEDAFYVLSNNGGKYGAAALLDKEMMKGICERFGDGSSDAGFYIIPSSVHEVLIIPEKAGIDKACLEDMVKEVNCTTVGEGDRLSDHIYKYNVEKGLRIA